MVVSFLSVLFMLFFCSCAKVPLDGLFGDVVIPSTDQPPVPQLEIDKVSITGEMTNTFNIEVSLLSDVTLSPQVELYICNKSDDINCEPSLFKTLAKSGNVYSGTVIGLDSPYDPGDSLEIMVKVKETYYNLEVRETSQLILQPTKIFRSSGIQTTALSDSSCCSMSISEGVASFSSPMPDNVGVGDAIQYDMDGVGGIDTIIFIHNRINSEKFNVKLADGRSLPSDMTGNSSWSLFRSYSSFSAAESGSENGAINGSVRNFDTWSGGKNLTLSEEQWNIVLYADGEDTSGLNVNGWTPSSTYPLNIFSAYLENQVGVTQRHNGVWNSSKVHISKVGGVSIIQDTNVSVDGVQIEAKNIGDSNILEHRNTLAGEEFELKNSIIKTSGVDSGTNPYGIFVRNTGTVTKLYNNIIYNVSPSLPGADCVVAYAGAILYAYNNTIYNCGGRGVLAGSTSIVYAKNNIVQASGTLSFSTSSGGVFDSSSNFNISDDSSSSGGTNDFINITDVGFNSIPGEDFRLTSTDLRAKGQGVNLANDSLLPFNSDMIGVLRGSVWDIGAVEYAE